MFVQQFSRGPRHSRARGLVVALTAAACVLTGCQPQSSSAHERNAQNRLTPVATVTFCSHKPAACSSADDFSIGATSELEIKTAIEHAAPGNHTQSLEIVMPDGRQYQETKVGFRVVAESTEPVEAMRTIPIAGTWVQSRHVTGVWKVRCSLDGQVLATAEFRLEP